MVRAYEDAKLEGWSREPIVEMLIPSTVDESLAPAGCHVASLFCQQFAPILPDGRNWDDEREAAADHVIATVDAHAPGFARSVIARDRSEEHTSELQPLMRISYAVLCLTKKKTAKTN